MTFTRCTLVVRSESLCSDGGMFCEEPQQYPSHVVASILKKMKHQKHNDDTHSANDLDSGKEGHGNIETQLMSTFFAPVVDGKIVVDDGTLMTYASLHRFRAMARVFC